MSTLILSGREVRKLLQMPAVIGAVEQAFRDWGLGKGHMPAKSYLALDRGDFRAMPASLPGAVGIKWVNVHPQNPTLGLPTVMAILVYNDPDTGYPLAIMDATDLTAYRTGAAAAIAAKHLARADSRTLGIVGAGRQAYTQLLAHVQLFQFDAIRVFDISPTAVERLIKSYPEYPVHPGSLEETVASDIVCTVTPAREPVVKQEWVKPGTHINAIGADAEGKEELAPSILKKALVVVDDIQQASKAGEINVPISRGLFRIEDIHATLSEIIIGQKPGRKDPKAITVFDSTGVAIEDVAVARLIYDKAPQGGEFLSLDLLNGGTIHK